MSRVQLSFFLLFIYLLPYYTLSNNNMSLNALPFSHLDDNEFAAIIYEFRNGLVRFDPEKLSNLSINYIIKTSLS